MSTLLEERHDTILVEETEPEDPSKVAHYFEKVQFDKHIFEGKPMVALCGYVKTDTPQDFTQLPVCEPCKFLMENVVGTNLPGGGNNE